jgi:hypothetical protein
MTRTTNRKNCYWQKEQRIVPHNDDDRSIQPYTLSSAIIVITTSYLSSIPDNGHFFLFITLDFVVMGLRISKPRFLCKLCCCRGHDADEAATTRSTTTADDPNNGHYHQALDHQRVLLQDACTTNTIRTEEILRILTEYPELALEEIPQNNLERPSLLPIHHLLKKGQPDLQTVKLLLDLCPESFGSEERYPYGCLNHAFSNATHHGCPVDVLDFLIEEFIRRDFEKFCFSPDDDDGEAIFSEEIQMKWLRSLAKIVPHLQRLDSDYVEWTLEAWKGFCTLLEGNESITEFSTFICLEEDCSSPEGIEALLSIIKRNCTVERMFILGNYIGKSAKSPHPPGVKDVQIDALKLTEALAASRGLKVFVFTGYLSSETDLDRSKSEEILNDMMDGPTTDLTNFWLSNWPLDTLPIGQFHTLHRCGWMTVRQLDIQPEFFLEKLADVPDCVHANVPECIHEDDDIDSLVVSIQYRFLRDRPDLWT